MTGADRFEMKVLFRDKSFLSSAVVSLASVAVVVIGTVAFMSKNRIVVHPVSDVVFINEPSTTGAAQKVRQISQLGEGKAQQGDIYSGYFADLRSLCAAGKLGETNTKVVFFHKTTNASAATLDFRPNTCALVAKAPSDDFSIYAASDAPFVSVKSERRFIQVER
jgi:hypothetical protein